jgi:ribonuclease VapC
MFIDASVIVAILGRESGHEELEKRLAEVGENFYISPLVRFEAAVALARKKAAIKQTPELLRQAQAATDAFIEDLGAEEVPISAEIGRGALAASAAYGKTVGHPADLNFGDCFAYACAKALKVALFYKGDDFAHTDLA